MSRIGKLLEPVKRRVLLALARGVVQLAAPSKKCQELQISLLTGEVRQMEQFQEYGFASVPKRPDSAGAAEAFVGFVGGNRDHGVVLGTVDRRSRPIDLAEGDSLVYNHLGARVWCVGQEVRIRSGPLGSDKTVRLLRDKVRIESGESGLSLEVNDQSIIVRHSANHSITVEGTRIIGRMGEKTLELSETQALIDMGASGVKAQMNDSTLVLHCGANCRIRMLPASIAFEAPAVTFVQT